jgi:hypothetical protein
MSDAATVTGNGSRDTLAKGAASDTSQRRLTMQIVTETDSKYSERVARAAAHVNATELADGDWAYYANETGRWYVVDADDLESLCDYLDDGDEQVSGDAYSHWCAATDAREMPEGWEPGVEIGARQSLVEARQRRNGGEL